MKVTKEMVANIIHSSELVCQTRLGRITVVTMLLPNGWTITESSASVSIENYDYKYGIDVCMKKIEEKIWELEAYRLKSEEYIVNKIKEAEKLKSVEDEECIQTQEQEKN